MHTELRPRLSQTSQIGDRYNPGAASHPDSDRYNPGSASHPDRDRYNPGSASHPDRDRYNPGSASHPDRDRYNPGSASHPDRDRYNPGSASHPDRDRYNPGSASHPDRDRYNPGSASHPDRDRYNPGSASHPDRDRYNPGSASHPDRDRYNQGSASHPHRDRYNPGSASHPDRDRYNPGSASHPDRDRYNPGYASHPDKDRYNPGGSASLPDRDRYNSGSAACSQLALPPSFRYPAHQHMPPRCHAHQHAKFSLREVTGGAGPATHPHPRTRPTDAHEVDRGTESPSHFKQHGDGSQLYTSSVKSQTVLNNTAGMYHQSPLWRGQSREPQRSHSMYGCRSSRHNQSSSLTNRSSRQPPLSRSNSPVSSHQQPARCAYISPIKHGLSQAAPNKYPDISPVSNKILCNSHSPPSPHCDRINLHTTYAIPCRPPPTQYSHIQTSSPWLPQCRHTLSSRFDLPLRQNMSPPEHRIPPRLNITPREPGAATSLYTFKPFLDEPSTRPSPKQHPCTSPSRLSSLSACAEVSPPQSRFPRFSRSSPSRHCLPTHPLNGPPLRPELSPGPTAPRSVLAPCPKRCFTNHYGYLDYCPVPDLPSYTPNSLWWEEQAALTLRRSQAERRHSRPTTTLPETGSRPDRDIRTGSSPCPADVFCVHMGKRGGDALREVDCSKRMKLTQKSAPPSLLNQRRIKVLNKALGLARRSPKKPSQAVKCSKN
ncbi:uncharacterized protein LOC124118864 [Haliotis rufescens]|uniref:uncharacterized protein LOC124118864 n=1 Tax=Haliotis rufescens TaxID=6454 RepID=UPI001EAFC709|nr:uncharacterized protein LOC124118864 [Haliotis rufescens]